MDKYFGEDICDGIFFYILYFIFHFTLMFESEPTFLFDYKFTQYSIH